LTWRVAYHPDAFDELAQVALVYDSYSPGLGDTLMAHWEHILERLREFPESSELYHHSARKALLIPFQLLFLYRHTESAVHILAVVDARRDPDVIRGIIDARLPDE
jgi:hypothetical protein